MNFLEDYNEVLELLPKELQRHMTNMLELDSIYQENENKIEQIITNILHGKKVDPYEERQNHIQALEECLADSMHFSKCKIFLTNQAYDSVDRYIRRLDNDLNRFNISLARHKADKSSQEQRDIRFRTGDISDGFGLVGSSGRLKRNPTGRSGRVQRKTGGGGGSRGTSGGLAGGGEEDGGDEAELDIMDANPELFEEYPIDPNEPRYCLCNQVSFGEMIACDNDDCDIKWFHFDCIGIDTLPKGKWFCPVCSGKQKKKK